MFVLTLDGESSGKSGVIDIKSLLFMIASFAAVSKTVPPTGNEGLSIFLLIY